MQISELVALPIEQRVRVMEALWDSLSHDLAYEPSPEWHAAVLAERRTELDQGETDSWSGVKERLAKLTKGSG